MRVPTLRLLIPSVTFCALAVALVGTGVRAQTDLDAGKSGPQLFAQDCAACHRSPQGLLKNISSFGLVGFLRQHYTSSSASANTVAAYLQGVANARPADPKKGKGTESSSSRRSSRRPGKPARRQRPRRRPRRRRARANPQPSSMSGRAAARRASRGPLKAFRCRRPSPRPPQLSRPSRLLAAAPEPAKQAAAAPAEPGFAEPLP